MLRWEFEHLEEDHSPLWQWRALRSDGRVYRRSQARFPSFMQAFEDASRHGFDRLRHAWKLATRRTHAGAFDPLTRQLRTSRRKSHSGSRR